MAMHGSYQCRTSEPLHTDRSATIANNNTYNLSFDKNGGSLSSKKPSRFALLFTVVAVAAAAAAGVAVAQNTAQDFVNQHNSPRADVGVGSVTWNTTVAAYAQSYADQRAAGDCALAHSGGPYGENLFWGSAGYGWAASDAVGSWVAEKPYDDHATNACSAPSGQSCGHYTQVVWRASTAIGCARAVCGNNAGVFIICNYYPPGNVIGQSPY